MTEEMTQSGPSPESASPGSASRICAELRRLEEALLDPAVRRNRARVTAMLTEDMREFGASGRIWTRDSLLELLATEAISPQQVEDFECRELAEGVALVTYRLIGSDLATGRHKSSLRSSIWVRQSGDWRLRFHQGTREP